MSVESAFLKYTGLASTIGKKAISALYPNDFELYITAFELVSGDGNTEAYFIFPIQPFSISEQNRPIQNIKKTLGGITVLNTQTFSPTDTILQGNFGRKFKFLLGKEYVNFSAFLLQPNISKPEFASEFDGSIKTGYGCIKVLESIIKKSNTLYNGKPYALYMYNLALGQSYLVKITSYDFYQNQENNMIWHYNLAIKSLLPVDKIKETSQRSLAFNLAANQVLQKSVDSVGSFLASMLTIEGQSSFGRAVVSDIENAKQNTISSIKSGFKL